jgi:hypothetical protein
MDRPANQGSTPPPGAGDSYLSAPYSGGFASSVPAESVDGGNLVAPRPVPGSARPGALTWTAIYFYVRAGLGALYLVIGVGFIAAGRASSAFAAGFFFGALLGGALIYASYLTGRRLWERDEAGRGIGKFLTGLGAVLSLLSLARTGSPWFLFIGILDAVVFCYLWQTNDLIDRSRG